MNTLAIEIRIPDALNVSLTDDTLSVDLGDGRSISAPTVINEYMGHRPRSGLFF